MLAAQVTGVALLRLANAEVLPFDYEAYGRQILEYIGEIEDLAATTRPPTARSGSISPACKAAADAFAAAGVVGARARRCAAGRAS